MDLVQVDSIIFEARKYPREDLLHEAALNLSRLVCNGADVEVLGQIAKKTKSDVIRAVVLRALGYGSGDTTDRLEIIYTYLSDDSTEVRDAAVSALVDLGSKRALPILQKRMIMEDCPLILEAIVDAITELEELP